ncbi:M20 family metallopeptidase [Arthrobacter sp. E918]|uniref:M20 family metallopeptidase n=2 Tax=Arthrobacter mobilis TaxID=2724944 RepID=A0A7X6K761_9MICC|nr:M20 family metallopeptidase [Arthrobacter mobilis]
MRPGTQLAEPVPQELAEKGERYLGSGEFFAELAGLVRQRTESAGTEAGVACRAYLTQRIAPILEQIGCTWRIVENEVRPSAPFLLAHRIEAPGLPTALLYGHGDVVEGQSGEWSAGRDPWTLTAEGDRWYGRGAADNKGQHLLNLAALRLLVEHHGRLGFNLTVLIESGEEVGSPGLAEFARAHREELRADVFIASDGPRLDVQVPTLFLGARGGVNLTLEADLRAGQHHSGNWGGLLRNAATTVAGAVGTLVDGHGRIRCAALLPAELPASVRLALATVDLPSHPGGPSIDENWADPGLTPAERVFGWNTLEVLSLDAGNADAPMNAIPGRARAVLQLRFVAGTETDGIQQQVQRHLDAEGYPMVRATVGTMFPASRTDPDHPWARWAADSLRRQVGERLAVLPNIGGSLPNYVFTDILGLPTLWVPHSYPGCNQHAPDEHLLESVAREGLAMALGLFADLGDPGRRPAAACLSRP